MDETSELLPITPDRFQFPHGKIRQELINKKRQQFDEFEARRYADRGSALNELFDHLNNEQNQYMHWYFNGGSATALNEVVAEWSLTARLADNIPETEGSRKGYETVVKGANLTSLRLAYGLIPALSDFKLSFSTGEPEPSTTTELVEQVLYEEFCEMSYEEIDVYQRFAFESMQNSHPQLYELVTDWSELYSDLSASKVNSRDAIIKAFFTMPYTLSSYTRNYTALARTDRV